MEMPIFTKNRQTLFLDTSGLTLMLLPANAGAVQDGWILDIGRGTSGVPNQVLQALRPERQRPAVVVGGRTKLAPNTNAP